MSSLSRYAILAALVLGLQFDAAPQGSEGTAAETQTAVNRYCIGCHNERLKTAGLVLDPSVASHPGDQMETWEKVLRQVRSGTMPPPGSPRPDAATYNRIASYLGRELESYAGTHPNAGQLPAAHRLTRTEYHNAVRDLLDLPALPKELDYSTLLPTDNVSSGFDNLADTLFMTPGTTERYVEAARKIARVAVGDPSLDALVNIHITPSRQPQEARVEDLPFGTRGGTSIDSYFPLDGEYEFLLQTAGAGRDEHRLEVSIDGERKSNIAIAAGRRREEVVDAEAPDQDRVRFTVPAGRHKVGIAFVERSQALAETALRPPGRSRGRLPNLVGVTISGPFKATGPGNTPTRQRLFVCRPENTAAESACADRILKTLVRRLPRTISSRFDVSTMPGAKSAIST